MPASTVITVPQLARLIGLPDSPTVVDVRLGEDYRADRRLLPGSSRRDFLAIGTWAPEYRAKNVIVVASAVKSSAKVRPLGFGMKASTPRRWKAALQPGGRRASLCCEQTICQLMTTRDVRCG